MNSHDGSQDAVFAQLPDSYVLIDCDFVIRAVTNAFVQVTGTPATDLIGRNVFDVFPGNPAGGDPGPARLRASLQRVFDLGIDDVLDEQRYDVLDASTGTFEVRYWQTRTVPVLRGGDVAFVVHRTEEHTDSVQDQAAALADKLAAAKAKERRLSQLSHDLRTPLNAVLGFGQLLESELSDPEPHESVHEILVAGRQLTEKVDQVLGILNDASTELASEVLHRTGGDEHPAAGIEMGEPSVRSLVDHVTGMADGGTGGRDRPEVVDVRSGPGRALSDDHADPGRLTIVVYIEDHPANRRLMQQIIDRIGGVALHLAPDAATGLTLIADIRPDLVLLDLGLPDSHGLDVLKVLDSDKRFHRPAVVIVSADSTPTMIAEATRRGVLAYLTKPFDLKELAALLETARARSTASAAAGP
jgi:CheY-like chemotaxis protein